MVLVFQMNQLQSELSLARSLISERDSEIQRVQSTNNQVFTSKHPCHQFVTLCSCILRLSRLINIKVQIAFFLRQSRVIYLSAAVTEGESWPWPSVKSIEESK